MINRKYKGPPIVIGGIHPTAFPEYTLSYSGADFVILGEGEFSTAALLMSIVAGETVANIDGLAYKDNGTVVINPKTRFIQELDELPFPAYHLLDIDKYKRLCRNDRISQIRGINFSLLTSRSCPYQCTYCNMFLSHGRKWRARSPENVLDEIEHLVRRYEIHHFAIVDDNFLLSRKRARRILQGIIDRNLQIKFITPNGLSVRTLDDELVRLLKDAGALEISIAVESGSDFIRNDVYNKKISSEQIYRVIESCRRHRLPVRAFFMIGAPGESDTTIKESLQMMRRIKVPAYINITTPYKGTKLYDYCLERGNIREEDIRSGTWVDIRLPIEKAENYDQILGWRRKMQIYNILYSWKDILFSPTFFNVNALSRFSSGILFSKKIDRNLYSEILDRYMQL
jgi:magnesium-protoporphyrin IX monomethyl ester (oxidative) cyclase